MRNLIYLAGSMAVSLGIFLLCLRDVLAQPAPTPESLYAQLKQTYPHNKIHDPAGQQKGFIVHPDFEVTLFASSPWVVNPIAMAWDTRNRLWVINSPTYPQILPGQRDQDFISVLEDTDDDGRADKCAIFYDDLYVPTGLALGDGGVYVANQPDLLFLKDTDGDLRADEKRILLSGFGTEDNHHAISAFRWSPGGQLHFMSGIFLHNQIETPHGLVRLAEGGTFELKPRELKLGFYNVGTATNPWGLAFDKWGQSFLTEGPQGNIWHLNPGTVSNNPRERVPDTRAPKACGNEFIYSSHFSEEYQGMMVLNAFKNKTVNLYRFSDDGAGYSTREQQPLLIRSREKYFRPVDVKTGPDGAIYVADFFQEVIGHMQYEFRDPRRDHLNGRIWRITQKGRKLLPRPNFVDKSIDELVKGLSSPESYIREKTRRELYERSASDKSTVQAALDSRSHRLQSANASGHELLELLWAYQTIDVVNSELLDRVLRSPEPHARAAGLIVLRYWIDHIPNALNLLARAIEDDHPRVRMEALCALSYIPDSRTMEIAARAADLPMDRTLRYTLKHTSIALKDQWLPDLRAGKIDFDGDANRLQTVLSAVGTKDSAEMLLNLLESGQIPHERRGRLLLLIAALGDTDELAVLFDQKKVTNLLTMNGGTNSPATIAELLTALARAARERNVKPKANAEDLLGLLQSDRPEIRTATVRLIGAWGRKELNDQIVKIAVSKDESIDIRRAAIESLAELGGAKSSEFLAQLATNSELQPSAVAGLAQLDLNSAAHHAGQLLSEKPDNPKPYLAAILARKGGADILAAELKTKELNTDAAKLALRYMNSIGNQHPALTAAFSTAIGSGSLSAELSKVDIQNLIKEVESAGDAHRGELVFRRRDLACLSCHAIAGGGADIGPDLEGIGTSSPMDYIVESILLPDKAIREGFNSIALSTDRGKIYHGIEVAKTRREIVLKDAAARKIVRIPRSSVEEVVDAPSIMPQGLVDQMTRQEFLDLTKFISRLGRPGPFAAPNIPVIRSWRVLRTGEIPFEKHEGPTMPWRLDERDSSWETVAGTVSGELPFSELGDKRVTWVRAKIDVGIAGKIMLEFDRPEGLLLVTPGNTYKVEPKTPIEVGRGEQILTFRIEKQERNGKGLKVTISDVQGSPAKARILSWE